MGIHIKGVIKATLFSLFITFIVIFILALLAFFTSIAENVLVGCAYGAVAAGVLLGSIFVSRAAQQKALIHAMLLSLIYAVVLTGIAIILNGMPMFSSRLMFIIIGIFAAGFVGSVIGK